MSEPGDKLTKVKLSLVSKNDIPLIEFGPVKIIIVTVTVPDIHCMVVAGMWLPALLIAATLGSVEVFWGLTQFTFRSGVPVSFRDCSL